MRIHLIRRAPGRATGLAVAALLAAVAARAEPGADWPQWRGPDGSGSASTGTYPVRWDATNHLYWKAALPGKGCSTPAVWNGRIYVTAPVEHQNAVLSFDWNGMPLGQTLLGPERAGKSANGSGCNPSPAVDAQGLFVYFKSGELAGLDLDGKLRWSVNLQELYGADDLYWDLGTSPVLTKRNVVVAVLQHGGSFLAAFDQRTGERRWKVPREYETPVECDHSYATPLLHRERGREELLVWGAQHLTAHDAENGDLLWWCGGFNPGAKKNWVVIASPVLAGDMVVIPYGRGALLYGIKTGGSGDVTSTHRAWEREDTGCFVPTPAAYRGRVYLLRDRGEVVCVNPATGRTVWSGEFPKSSASYYSSPVLADGKLYAAREDGAVFVARVGARFEVLARNDMGERVIAAPVPVSGRLLIRGDKHLFCAGAD